MKLITLIIAAALVPACGKKEKKPSTPPTAEQKLADQAEEATANEEPQSSSTSDTNNGTNSGTDAETSTPPAAETKQPETKDEAGRRELPPKEDPAPKDDSAEGAAKKKSQLTEAECAEIAGTWLDASCVEPAGYELSCEHRAGKLHQACSLPAPIELAQPLVINEQPAMTTYNISYRFACSGHSNGLELAAGFDHEQLKYSTAESLVHAATIISNAALYLKDADAKATFRATLIGRCDVRVLKLERQLFQPY